MNYTKTIGLIAGVGPYAGLDLQKKILDLIDVPADQDYPTVIAYSGPASIPDRTRFLMGQTAENPAEGILAQLFVLEQAGVAVAGIPCNTAHAPAIFDQIKLGLLKKGSQLILLNMIECVAEHLRQARPESQRVGLLATIGTYHSQVYHDLLRPAGFEVVVPAEPGQQVVQAAIQHPEYGIKRWGYATERVRADLLATIDSLKQQGAEAIILGCTELPLALPETAVFDLPLIDPTLILAQALLQAAA